MKFAISSVVFVALLQGALGSTPPAVPPTSSVAHVTPTQTYTTTYQSQYNVTTTVNITAYPSPTDYYPCIYPTDAGYNATRPPWTTITGNGTYNGTVPSPTAHHHENWGNATATASPIPYPSGCIPYYPNGTATANVTTTVNATGTFIGNITAPTSAPTNGTNGTTQNLNGGNDPRPGSAIASLNLGFSGAAVAVFIALASMI